MEIRTIVLPTRPQPDTIVAIFLLRTFGEKIFQGITTAQVSIQHTINSSESFDSLIAQGILPIDVGGGPFDHHMGTFCASELVAKYLGIEKDPSIARLLQYARRDDTEGKGTLSTDAVDRAFGLSGLVASLNKMHTKDPQKIVQIVLPLLEAHYASAREHHIELPHEVENKKKMGHYREIFVAQSGKKFKVAFVVSDKPSMPTYLRSQQGPRADIVVQKSENTNHICILSRQERKIDLSKIAALIRLREGQLQGIDLGDDHSYLGKTGRIDEVSYWYFDPATNSLLNGGPHNTSVKESKIPWEEMIRIVEAGIEIGGSRPSDNISDATYYLSVNIPENVANQILSNVAAAENVKVHAAKNLHVTLEYLGPQSSKDAKNIAIAVQQALSGHEQFTLSVKNSQLQFGSPEGYTNAWFLHLEAEDGGDKIRELRNSILPSIGLPLREKQLHITLGVKRADSVPDESLSFFEPFAVEVPVSEVVLMENAAVNGKRVYRAHSIFPLQEPIDK